MLVRKNTSALLTRLPLKFLLSYLFKKKKNPQERLQSDWILKLEQITIFLDRCEKEFIKSIAVKLMLLNLVSTVLFASPLLSQKPAN